MTDLQPIGSYPNVYDSKILNTITPTGIGDELTMFREVKQGGYKNKSKGKWRKKHKPKSKRLSKRSKNKKTLRK
jgi:hypothetical protein